VVSAGTTLNLNAMHNTDFKIDLTETFAHLPNAPIVEAVIHWRARPQEKLDPDALIKDLEEKLPDYANSQRQQEFGVEAEFGRAGSSFLQYGKWHGFRFETENKLNIAQFTRNGFVFSRLKPYEGWQQFEAEGLRLWQIYCDLALPFEIQRLGVRFINLIAPVRLDHLNDLLSIPPHSPPSFPLALKGFMHQTTFDIRGYPYNLNVIQTIQPPSSPHSDAYGCILDLDVFTTQPLEINEEQIKRRLEEMRWVKNKAFVAFLDEGALARFQEQL
jgi:uncharacterized protein (TIGR04255 family)